MTNTTNSNWQADVEVKISAFSPHFCHGKFSNRKMARSLDLYFKQESPKYFVRITTKLFPQPLFTIKASVKREVICIPSRFWEVKKDENREVTGLDPQKVIVNLYWLIKSSLHAFIIYVLHCVKRMVHRSAASALFGNWWEMQTLRSPPQTYRIRTCSFSIIWELVRNADSQAPITDLQN